MEVYIILWEKYLGKIETNGNSYDSRGGYMGRIDG